MSTAGGCRNAPQRAADIGATAIQIFTKQPNRWAEVHVADEECDLYRGGIHAHGVAYANAHDSYLINLATADPVLRDRSLAAFRGELRRANRLGLDALVTHPGNATDGDFTRGLWQNAELIEQAMEEEGGRWRCCWRPPPARARCWARSFEQLRQMIDRMSPAVQGRVGFAWTPATSTPRGTTCGRITTA